MAKRCNAAHVVERGGTRCIICGMILVPQKGKRAACPCGYEFPRNLRVARLSGVATPGVTVMAGITRVILHWGCPKCGSTIVATLTLKDCDLECHDAGPDVQGADWEAEIRELPAGEATNG